MEFVFNNWEYVLLAFFVLEKIVKLTPCKWDDILIDAIKSALFKAKGDSKKK